MLYIILLVNFGNMIEIKEAIVNSVRPLKNRSIAVTLWIKSEDISKQDIEKLNDCWTMETPVALVIQDFEKNNAVDEEKERLNKKKTRLEMLITEYCEKTFSNKNEELERLYKKYWVTSRRELTETQLNECIDSYEAGLIFNNR